MSRTIEKVILGILVIAIVSISSLFITGLDSSNQKDTTTKNNNFISLEQAKIIALGVTDGTITEAVLEKENGLLVYEIEITNGNLETDVNINPSNGDILNIETEIEEEIIKLLVAYKESFLDSLVNKTIEMWEIK